MEQFQADPMPRRRPNGRRRFLGAGVAAVAAACAACGQRSSRGGAAVAGTTPKAGGALRLRTTRDFFDFDTSGAGKSSPNANATTLCYETLVAFRRDPALAYDDMQAVPHLAENWETPDAQTFAFRLRPGITFASFPPVGGRPLSSADVKWAFEYASRTGQFAGNNKLPAPSFGFLLDGLNSVDTPDDRTAVFHFNQPYAPFINYCYDRALQILPHEIFDQDGNFSSRMVGTGPFLLDTAASQHGSRWVFRKNPGYWQNGRPYLDEIDYLVIADDSAAIAALQAGQLDILQGLVDPKSAGLVQKAAPAVAMQRFAAPSAHGIFMNEAHPPFDDPRLRKALALAVDHDEFDKTFGAGQGQWPATCALPDWLPQEEVRKLLPYDPNQARQILSAAGLANGLSVDYLDKMPQFESENVLLQAQLKRVGITMNIQATDAAGASTALHTGKFTLYPTSNTIEGDMDYLLFENYYSKSTGNYVKSHDSQLDSMLLAQRRESDATKRAGLLKDISRYMTQSSFQLDLYYPQVFTFWGSRVHGYRDHWQQDDFNTPYVWLQA